MKAPIDKCLHCGSVYGYYTKDYLHGGVRHCRDFDGEGTSDNAGIFDSLTWELGKWAYCLDCGKRIFRAEEATP